MRQNAEDLQNFMKELNNWEEEVKKKDQQLRTGNISEPLVKLWDSEQTQYRFRCFFFCLKCILFQKTLPPVRNKDYKKTKKSVKHQTNGDGGLKEQKETQRIKSYDYQAWDKFDVVILCILIHAPMCIKTR